MGLDLYIETREKIKHQTTGVYIRENGMNKELKTIEEVKKYFPNRDISHIYEYEYVDNYIFNRHMTHNLSEMAEHIILDSNINLYLLLWHPSDLGFKYVDEKYVNYINKSLELLIRNKKKLEKYNPKNGWGNYETLLGFVRSLANCLNNIDVKNKEYSIYSSI